MARTVEEWIGKTDDTIAPPRTRLRIFDRCKGRCQGCGCKVGPAVKPFAYDHITALVNGGENRESNLQILCDPCHAIKTRKDMAEKSRFATRRKRQHGYRKSRPLPGTKASGIRKRMNGDVERW